MKEKLGVSGAEPAGSVVSPLLAAELFEQCLLVAPTLNLRDIGARLLAPLVRATTATRASMMIVNPETGRLRVVAGLGIRPEIIGRDTEWRPNSISEWVYRKRQGLVLNGDVRGETLTGSSEEAIESAICVPLETADAVMGVVNLARMSPSPIFSQAEMEEVHGLLPPVAAAIERANRARRSAALADQLGSASGLEGHTLLKPGLHVGGHYEFGYARASSLLEGGDFCERVPFASGAHALLAADVSGHGAEALLAAAYTLGVFAGNAAAERSAAGMVARLNTEIFNRLGGATSVALWTAQLSPNGQVSSCNGGYPEPLWVPTEDSPIVRLASGGPAAGAQARARWEEEQIRMLPGDMIVAVSNGIIEAKNVTGSTFGAERLFENVAEMRRHSPELLAETIVHDALAWAGRDVPTDDLVVLAFRFRPGE